MVVATLPVTIAFAAAFTLPGGYTSEGTATLARRTAFRIYCLQQSNYASILFVLVKLLFIFSFKSKFRRE